MTATQFKKILKANKDNTEMLSRIVSEVNNWNGELESYEVHEFDDEFFDMMFEGRPLEAARATYFGDIQSWMDSYIRFNGYGNLESLSLSARDEELKAGANEIIEAALDNTGNIDREFITEGLEA